MSMTLGRPTSISAHTSRPNLPVPLPAEKTSPLLYFKACMSVSPFPKLHLSLKFGTFASTLYTILGHTLDSPHNPLQSDAYDIVKHLAQWRTEVPLDLANFLNDTSETANAAQQSRPCVVLALKYLTVQMFVYRPFIVKALDNWGKRSDMASGANTPVFDYNTCLADHALCTGHAMRIVAILKSLSNANQSWKGGSSWYRLYYVFSAFSVLAGFMLHDPLDPNIAILVPEIPEQSLRMSACWDCMALMSGLSEDSAAAARCLRISQRLLEGVFRCAQERQARSERRRCSHSKSLKKSMFRPRQMLLHN